MLPNPRSRGQGDGAELPLTPLAHQRLRVRRSRHRRSRHRLARAVDRSRASRSRSGCHRRDRPPRPPRPAVARRPTRVGPSGTRGRGHEAHGLPGGCHDRRLGRRIPSSKLDRRGPRRHLPGL